MEVGLVGKPNVGKSTFFSAATKAPAEIANYPFTTIEPNRGVAYLRVPCPHVALGLPGCTPRTGLCQNGIRYVPVELLDVAGIVPDAHTGKGLGNKFLSDLSQAAALLHVVDASGATDAEGNPVPKGTRDPTLDVQFLEDEIAWWIQGIIMKDFGAEARRIQMSGEKLHLAIHRRVTGIGIDELQVIKALQETGLHSTNPLAWTDTQSLELARTLRKYAKPIIVAANKADQAAPENVTKLKGVKGYTVIPACAQAELVLRKAADAGLITYLPGDKDFTIKEGAKLTEAQRKGLELIRETVLHKYGSTGVQEALETAVFQVLDRVVVFPVMDETHATDAEGRVLPDAHLLPRGTTAKQLAYKVHTDLGEHFVRGVNAKTKRTVGADYACEHGDVIRIVASK
ncbi:MAG TPA: redox-regulated ATPase YchF [Candidatus Thermoplasmatota archaeon]|nr:redox-regulated ATPase YchF [Candidatus Thermoplasmatota archaeon]